MLQADLYEMVRDQLALDLGCDPALLDTPENIFQNAEHYLRVMLKSLENKGAVECCSFEQRGKQYARRFRCTVTKEEYYVQLAEKGGANLNGVFRATAVAMTKKADKESQEELLKKLEEIMEEYRTRDDGEE